MPLSMKVQPIGSHEESSTTDSSSSLTAAAVQTTTRPVVKSRLRRLFRIGTTAAAATDEPVITTTTTTTHPQTGGGDANNINNCFEPSSVCLAKMVQNFIEAENDNNTTKQSVKCGRNRCNCFNGGSDGSSDGENDGMMDAADLLKNLVLPESLTERTVLSDTSKIVDSKTGKTCKRKDDLRKVVVESLISLGYDASLCRSKWDKSPSFPAGEYEYVDVVIISATTTERLIVDVDFRSEFEIARSTKLYNKHILQTLPQVFVGKPERLKKIISVASEAVKQSLKKKGMHFPPWRKAEYFEAKWLSTPTRMLQSSSPAAGVVAVEEEIVSFGTKSDDDDEEVEVKEKDLSLLSSSASSLSSSAAAVVGDGGVFAMSPESSSDDEVEMGEEEEATKLEVDDA